MKRLLKYIILLIIITSIAGYIYHIKNTTTSNFLTMPVTRGNIIKSVAATGEVTATQLVTVGAQASGQIEKIYVELGQSVKKGDLIAQIDATTQQNLYDTEQARLESYLAQLASAEVALKISQTQYEREQSLTSLQARAQSNLEDAEQAYSAAKANITEIKSLIRQTEISLNTAKVNLGYTKILSPLEGTIVSIPVEEGQTVNASMSTPTIVQIADLTKMTILMEISEGDINNLQSGMAVTYSILSMPNEQYTTILKSIDPGLTTLSNGNYEKGASSDSAIYYYGRLEVPNHDSKLRIGMTTENNIQIAEADNVLIVPISAIKNRDHKKFIRILTDTQEVVEKEVETGLADELNIEIKNGVTEGEQLILEELSNTSTPLSQGPPRMM